MLQIYKYSVYRITLRCLHVPSQSIVLYLDLSYTHIHNGKGPSSLLGGFLKETRKCQV